VQLAHPAIVKVFDVDETDTGEPFIVMELLEGTSFGTWLTNNGRMPAVAAVRLLLPIADALRLAHEKGIVHRDVKPDNIFLVEAEGVTQPKLVDFGIVKMEREGERRLTHAGSALGSPEYMSPEQARGDAAVDHLSDVWAFSVVLYEALAGQPPFIAPNYNALMRQILSDTPASLKDLGVCDDRLSAIIARGLSKERELRFTSMRELGRALAEWLAGQGVNEDVCGTSLETKWLGGAYDGAATLESDAHWQPEARSGFRPRSVAHVPGGQQKSEGAVAGSALPEVSRARRRTATFALALLGVISLGVAGHRFATAPAGGQLAAHVPFERVGEKEQQAPLGAASQKPAMVEAPAVTPEDLPAEPVDALRVDPKAEEPISGASRPSRGARKFRPVNGRRPKGAGRTDLLRPY